MQSIERDELKTMLANRSDVTLIEVLDADHFRKFHLPGAVNVPVGDERFDELVQQAAPDKTKPVIVYCQNTECQASLKAAERMEALGYQQVQDYEAGKDDWKAAGLPVES